MQNKEVADRLRNVIRIAKRLGTASPMDRRQIQEAEELLNLKLLILEPEEHELLLGVIGDASDQIEGEIDVCAADKDQCSCDELRGQYARINALLGRVA